MYDETNNSEWTYKVLGNWEVKDWLRLRGGYNRATRSPNLGELFLNPQEIFTGGGSFGDPCSVRANAPFGAGGFTGGVDPVLSSTEAVPALAPGQTQAGADSTHLICQQMMGGPGSTAETQFYNVTNAIVQAGGGGFAWVLQQGNKDLKPEKADTWTAGFVLNSPLENPWLSGITVAFDWYMVHIDDAIMTYSIDYANYRCFGTKIVTNAAEAAAQAATPGCQLVPRDQFSGVALNTTLSYDNQATIETSGFDVTFNWSSEIAALGVNVPGRLGLSMQGTILDYYTTKQSPAPFDVETDWTGSLGPNLPGTNAGAYDYRLFGSLSYTLDAWNVAMRWRHLPSVWSATKAAQLALIDNNAAVTAGGPGIILGYTPSTEIETDSYDVFDLSFGWNINEKFALRGGITNVFDIDPNNSGSTAGYAPGSDISAAKVCGSAPGCRAPGGYSLPSVAGYNGGYNDTLGRRFFVGFKASF
jgi:outer membrane receptor protein involved in Fe transport